jgi:neutral ceramidase
MFDVTERRLISIILSISLFGLLLPPSARAESPWQAGAARAEITPDQFMWMAGYGSRTAPASGKLTELWAKALVLDDADGNRGVVIALDLVGIGRQVSKQVCSELKKSHDLSRNQIVICMSHTHSGPVVGKNLAPLHYWGVDEKQKTLIDQYSKKLVGQVVQVVGDAIDNLEPSRLQWGS